MSITFYQGIELFFFFFYHYYFFSSATIVRIQAIQLIKLSFHYKVLLAGVVVETWFISI